MKRAWLWMTCAVLVTGGVGALPARAARPGPDAVWTPPDGAIQRVHEELTAGKSAAEALAIAMKAGGAKPAALAFAARLGEDAGYAGELTTSGPLISGMLFFPLRANENAEPFVVDAADRLLRPALDGQVTPAELAKHPGYKQLKPTGVLYAWPPQQSGRAQPGEKGGTELVFEYRMKVCHGCPNEGVARVAYAFDAAGKYTGRRLIEVAPAPPEPEESAAPAAAPSPAR